MKKRSVAQDSVPVDVTAVVRGDVPAFTAVEVPPQVHGAAVGLGSFMRCAVRVVGLEVETGTNLRLLTIAVGSAANGKTKIPEEARRFLTALGNGSVNLARRRKTDIFEPINGYSHFWDQCQACPRISATMRTIARYADQVRFRPDVGQKATTPERTCPRANGRTNRRGRN